jgi:hypothetical protein
MTYLELVNAVMVRLREDEVATVAESNYSKLIGAFVNDAKRLVEDSWDWSALRTSFPITTSAGTGTYSLTDFGQRSKVLYVLDETTNREIYQQSLAQINKLNMATESANGTIAYYALTGTDANNDLQITFYQTPSTSTNITVYGVKRPESLVNDSDTVSVPVTPIIQWAYSYALIERGETGGQSGAEQALFAKNDLNTAIALDANQHPEELIWTTV